MSKFDDFKPGERVAHITVGDGVVTAIEDGCVYVQYDRPVIKGKPFTGAYDRRWFEIHPTFLFHRRVEQA